MILHFSVKIAITGLGLVESRGLPVPDSQSKQNNDVNCNTGVIFLFVCLFLKSTITTITSQ